MEVNTIDRKYAKIWGEKEPLQLALNAANITPAIGTPHPTQPNYYIFKEVTNIEVLQGWVLGEWLVAPPSTRLDMEMAMEKYWEQYGKGESPEGEPVDTLTKENPQNIVDGVGENIEITVEEACREPVEEANITKESDTTNEI